MASNGIKKLCGTHLKNNGIDIGMTLNGNIFRDHVAGVLLGVERHVEGIDIRKAAKWLLLIVFFFLCLH